MTLAELAGLRQEYMRERLDEVDVDPDPIAQFRKWFDEAVAAAVPMVNAMTLATVSADGQPSARIVLLKGVEERGFTFYTHYDSRKARDLAANARAALCIYWIELEREVRIEGAAEKTSEAESDTYFSSRPLGSRLAATISPQSAVIPDRQSLERSYAEIEQRHPEGPPRPAQWGGYRVMPATIEFWQGRANRLHDRLLYRKAALGGWEIVRLAP
ncbi:MAG TPA: pyridoxamine 5'-phosphate oxidase [Burkholderiales bacterium]|nr:pyridoxamine 5'-phosphate oxidase [Burkholderiales bacterium]